MSELQSFMLSQVKDGAIDSTAGFSVSPEKALEKLANFKLRDSTQWTVKVVQAIVAAKSEGPIEVKLGNKETSFLFDTKSSYFSPTELRAAFFDLKAHEEPSINHFCVALRTVGIKSGLKFSLEFKGSHDVLLWDGKSFLDHSVSRPAKCHTLRVSLARDPGLKNWIRNQKESARQNAALAETLESFCFVCPLPLRVDGRRIDSFRLERSRRANVYRFPLDILMADHKLSSLRLPQATFLKSGPGSCPWTFGLRNSLVSFGNKNFAEKKALVSGIAAVQSCSFLRTKHDRGESWSLTREVSELLWVLDGALVGRETIGINEDCALSLFVSAEGLSTDLTSLSLSEDAQKARRKSLALRSASKASVEQRPWKYSNPNYDSLYWGYKLVGLLLFVGYLLSALQWNDWEAGFLALLGLAMMIGPYPFKGRDNSLEAARQNLRGQLLELARRT